MPPLKARTTQKSTSVTLESVCDIVIKIILALFAAYVFVFVVPMVIARITYFGELEHQEGIFLNTIRFFSEGGNIYQPPDLNFAGVIYPPLYFFFVEPIIALFDIDFTVLRVFSWLCIVGSGVCAFAVVNRLTASRLAGVSWLILYLVMWVYYGWIDLIRLEALFMFFIFAGLCAYVHADNKLSRYVLAGCCFGLAAATKQTGFIFLPLLVLIACLRWRATAALIAGVVTLLIVYGAGYYLFGEGMIEWVFKIPSQHPIRLDVGFNLLSLWSRIFGGISVLLPTYLCIGAVLKLKKSNLNLKSIDIGLLATAYVLIAGYAACITPLFKEGSGPMNLALLNAFAALAAALVCGLALKSKQLVAKLLVLVALVLLLQQAISFINSGTAGTRVPNEEEADDYFRLVAFLKAQQGDVWVTTHPWVNVLAGKKPYLPFQQLGGEWAGAGHETLPKDISVALEQHQFAMIVLGQEYAEPTISLTFHRLLNAHYRFAGLLPNHTTITRLDGVPMLVKEIWVPK